MLNYGGSEHGTNKVRRWYSVGVFFGFTHPPPYLEKAYHTKTKAKKQSGKF